MSTDKNIFPYVPFQEWQYKVVSFPTANTAVRIGHTLTVKSPQDVIYMIVRQSGAGVISDAIYQTSFMSEWNINSIVLQSSVVVTATILLAVPKLTILES